MHILHGTYHLFPRRLAFRNDFCLGCAAARRSVQISTLHVFHVYGIPLLPLGRRKRWSCTECGRRPDERLKTRRSYKIAGLVILLFLSILFWMIPVNSEDATSSWIYRIGAPIAPLDRDPPCSVKPGRARIRRATKVSLTSRRYGMSLL